jgi:hypothetical protein
MWYLNNIKRGGGGYLFEWHLKELNNFHKFASLKNAYQYLISICITLFQVTGSTHHINDKV